MEKNSFEIIKLEKEEVKSLNENKEKKSQIEDLNKKIKELEDLMNEPRQTEKEKGNFMKAFGMSKIKERKHTIKDAELKAEADKKIENLKSELSKLEEDKKTEKTDDKNLTEKPNQAEDVQSIENLKKENDFLESSIQTLDNLKSINSMQGKLYNLFSRAETFLQEVEEVKEQAKILYEYLNS